MDAGYYGSMSILARIVRRWASRTRTRLPGYVLLFAIIALLAMMLLGMMSLQLAMYKLDYLAKERSRAQAAQLAEAGENMAEAYLRSLGTPPTGTLSSPLDGSSVALSNGTCRASIVPDAGNDGAWLKQYLITATGQAQIGGAVSTVKVKLRQQSFALYAYFSEQERSSVSGGVIWFYAHDQLSGPVFSNDTLHVAWDPSATHPMFYNTVGSTSAAIDWGSAGAPANAAHWAQVLAGGASALTLNSQPIPLPASTSLQQCAAWGAAAGFPTTNGIYLPSNGFALSGGLYITGDCQAAFSVDSATGNQIVTITQGSNTTTLDIDLVNNQTRATVNAQAPVTSAGTPNGVLYCTGNITSLQGTLADNAWSGSRILRANAWTVVADAAAGKSIAITNNLQYLTAPNAALPASSNVNVRAATLGLFANNVTIQAGCPATLTIDAVVLAGSSSTPTGSFSYAAYNTAVDNTLNLLGGVIQNQRGAVGTFNPSTYAQVTGYSKNYVYDPRMANTPPPYFPTTGGYDVLSWQCQGAG